MTHRIAHITDIHVERWPGWRNLFNKRLVGSTNLYLLGRRGHFTPEVQQEMVQAVLRLAPDLVVVTGDLTAQATPEEFEAARELLDPILSRIPTVILPGNHDTYTRGASREDRTTKVFHPHAGEGPWPRLHDHLGMDVIAVNSSRAALTSRGRVGAEQLERLDRMLGSSDRPALILIHYPLRGRRGQPHGPWTRALADARAVEEVLARHGHRIVGILHGHEHHGYRTALPTPHGEIPIFNPGASGYAHLPDLFRRAHFNVYTWDGKRLEVERYAHMGEAGFQPEPGGAYATGR